MYDLKLAVRTLFKSPGFLAVATLALALGIGANTAIFSLLYGMVLRPLPFPDQDRLLFIGEWSEQVPNMSVSYPDFLDWRERQRAFSGIGVSRTEGFNFVGRENTERITGAMASADIFPTLGVPPLRGRWFGAIEDKPGAERTVLISEGFWKRAFAGRESLVGEKIRLSGNFYKVVGIMPDSFQFPNAATDVWVPLGLFADQYPFRWMHPGLYAIARLKPGIGYDAGVADLKAIAAQLAQEHPDTNARLSVAVQRFTDQAFGTIRTALYVLLGAAGFVLLIACANVANLQLARAQGRGREFAVRAALGASRAQIVRQILIESLVLGALGCGLGILLASWGLDGLRSLLPATTPRLEQVGLNLPVLGFSVAIALVTSVVFGLLPALHASNQDLHEALAQGGRSGASPASVRWRNILIAGEFALTSVLLIGAGLMMRTLVKLYHAQPGFSVEHTLTFNWVLSGKDYESSAKRAATIDRALDRLRELPGVGAAAVINPLPLSGDGNQDTYYTEGSPLPEPGRQPSTEVFQVSADAFGALRIPIMAGRGFDLHDTASSLPVAVVDTEFAKRNFPGQDPIGKRFLFGAQPKKDSTWLTVVGVAAHIQNYRFGLPTREQVYTPERQDAPSAMAFVIRTTAEPEAIAAAVRTTMGDAAPDLPLFGLQTMNEVFVRSISTQRLTMSLLAAFAGLAMLLAGVGLYGVLAYHVGQRTREIGLRMALGATERSVVGLVLRHGVGLALIGLGIGVVAAAELTRALSAILFQVSPLDSPSFVGVAILLTGIGAIACWIPARRAARINPMEALRAE